MSIAALDTRGFIHWAPDVLRDVGIDVYVMPGAESRSTWKSGFRLDAIIWHHTATGPRWLDGHVAALLRDGRIDLKGPLSQVGVERDGTWVFVAMGRANHNGARTAKYGNDSLGLEFYNSGLGEPWPDAQVESGLTGIAAIRNYCGRDIPLLGHKESDGTRKIDPEGIAMGIARTRVATRQKELLRPTIPVNAPFILEDDVMHVELILAAYRRVRGAEYDPRVGDPAGWTHWMRALAAAKTPDERNGVVFHVEALLAKEAGL